MGCVAPVCLGGGGSGGGGGGGGGGGRVTQLRGHAVEVAELEPEQDSDL